MAKKQAPVSQPVISSLPLPASDNPLVIDLPDGQKLVVGKMESGTVIEVATWRGTGRPDSRTSRLMLGMSSADTQPQVNSDQSGNSGPQTPKGKFAQLNRTVLNFLAKIAVFMGFSKEKSTGNNSEATQSLTSKVRRNRTIKFKFKGQKPSLSFKGKKSDDLRDPDFQNWLESVTKNNSKLANFSLDTNPKEGKIKEVKKAAVKAPVKKATKKAAPKAGRSK
jgi:hypothetical protein